MKITDRLVALLLVLIIWTASANEFYVAPTGSANGDGSQSRPWDLQTALNQPSTVQPGDTLWLLGGVYTVGNVWTVFKSTLTGAPNAPITVRQYPGQQAAIEGALFQFSGGWVNYWGFEIRNSYPNHTTTEYGSWPTNFQVYLNGSLVDMCVSGFDLRVPNVKLINLILHDNIGGGIGISTLAQNSEVYGCLSYYNGWQGGDRGHGHGIYAQNADPSTAAIQESVFYGNYALGIQITGSGASPTTDNFHVEGNPIFLNGVLALAHQQNFLLGAYTGLSKNPVVISNYVYDTQGSSSDTYLGYTGGTINALVSGNYFETSTMFAATNLAMVLTGNTFLGGTLLLDTTAYPNNDYSTARPTANLVQVRPNRYEPGRANIIVFNWEGLTGVPVDLSSVLPVGATFEVRNSQDFLGAPVLTGTYQGGSINLPMTGLSVAKPAGAAAPTSTAPAFNVFVVLPASGIASPPPANTPPQISAVPDLTLAVNTTSTPIPFTVSDLQTPAANLIVTASSSNPTLLPASGIVLGGSGANRTVTLTPKTGQTGTATVTLVVSDGQATASTSFVLTVSRNKQSRH